MRPSRRLRLLPLVALAAAVGCGRPAARAPIPVVLDTDPALGVVKGGLPREVDDALAIVEALNSEELRPLGITVVFGNADLGRTLRTAEELVRVKGAGIGVYRGARSPVAGRGRIPVTPASTFMAASLERERLTILALGPLANLASLVANFPDAASRIDRVVAVLGRGAERPEGGSVDGPHPDFNFFRDPRAARRVVESGVPMVLIPPQLSRRVAITARHLDAIRGRGTPTAEHIARLSTDWLAFWQRRFPESGGFHPSDSVAVAYLLRPGLLRCEARGYRFLEAPADSDSGTPSGEPGARAGPTRAEPIFELGPGLDGPRLEFCHAFAPGGEELFLRELLARVH